MQCRRPGFDPWVGKIPWRRKWQPIPIFWPRESPWTEEPGGLHSWGRKESDKTERLTFFHSHPNKCEVVSCGLPLLFFFNLNFPLSCLSPDIPVLEQTSIFPPAPTIFLLPHTFVLRSFRFTEDRADSTKSCWAPQVVLV